MCKSHQGLVTKIYVIKMSPPTNERWTSMADGSFPYRRNGAIRKRNKKIKIRALNA